MSRSSLSSHLSTFRWQLSKSSARTVVAPPSSRKPPAKAEARAVFKSIFVQTIRHLLGCDRGPGLGRAILTPVNLIGEVEKKVVRAIAEAYPVRGDFFRGRRARGRRPGPPYRQIPASRIRAC